jgi:hypothetical protein
MDQIRIRLKQKMFKSLIILGEEQLEMKCMTNLYGITLKQELSGIE